MSHTFHLPTCALTALSLAVPLLLGCSAHADRETERDSKAPNEAVPAGGGELHVDLADNGFRKFQSCNFKGTPCVTCWDNPVYQVCCYNTGDQSCFVTDWGGSGRSVP